MTAAGQAQEEPDLLIEIERESTSKSGTAAPGRHEQQATRP